MSASKILSQIVDSAEKIKCGDVQQFPEAASVGDYFRQGDLYIHKIADVSGKQIDVVRQLAPGTTKGSRHCLNHTRVKMYRRHDEDALDGPQIKTNEAVTIEHPEHGDVVLPPGCYAITYQRAYAEELRRVAD